MTGDALLIRLRREQIELQRLIHINAFNHKAMDRYNYLSVLIARLSP
jgi:hypothetical protein